MPNPGDLLMGRYRILERIGSGGMATVHRAHDERLDRDVALKILLPNLAADPLTSARFAREARSLAAVAHEGIVAVHDVDAGDPATGREPFFVMELCSGGSLADRLGTGRRLAPDDLVPTLVSIADGLSDLHRRGMVHRDIKPQNILFGASRAKLADFGLAVASDGGGLSDLTMPGTAVGTLAYLAPEILAGERATPAADMYALGVVAFVGLTGEPPRPGSSVADLVAASRTAAPPVSTVAPELGPAFDEVVAAALAVRAAERPDALAFASGLTAALGRWNRDGGPARRAGATAAGAIETAGRGGDVAVARAPAGDGLGADEVTTAMAIPGAATAQLPVAVPAASPIATDDGRRPQPSVRFGPVGVVALVALLLIVAALAASGWLRSASPSAGLPGSARPSLSGLSAPPSASASATATSPSPPPSAAVDPVTAALRAMDDAISAARGGPDGLKGKDANDLSARVADIRRAVDAGDRSAARAAARKLDHRVADLAKDLSADLARALRDASASLVRALGG